MKRFAILVFCLLVFSSFSCSGLDLLQFKGNDEKAIESIEQSLSTAINQELEISENQRSLGDCVMPTKHYYSKQRGYIIFNEINFCDLNDKSMVYTAADLAFNVLTVEKIMGNVVLNAKNYVGDEVAENRQFSTIKITIRNISLQGLVGIESRDENGMRSTNHDINLHFESFDHKTNPNGLKNYHENTTELDIIIKNLIRTEIKQLVEQRFLGKLNTALKNVHLNRFFRSNEKLETQHKKRSSILDDFINNFVDDFVIRVRSYIDANNINVIDVRDFQRNFSYLTVKGEFRAFDGYVRDLNSLRRTSKFSLSSPRKKEFSIFGSLGLDNLAFGYAQYKAEIWKLGPSGHIYARAEGNSVKFKIVGETIKVGSKKQYRIKRYQLNVENLQKMKIDASGLGLPMNWLLSSILTWMTEYFKSDVIAQVEDGLRSEFDKYVGNGSTQFDFDI